MIASIIIPVWNGVAVITQCLDALEAQRTAALGEIICVDNASRDDSASLIAERYARVRLLRQPVNLGFAGGVNAGIDAAKGELLLLLNQDCIVQRGWLDALVCALDAHPECGVAGCTILNDDGTLNHTGAYIRKPDANSVHLTELCDAPRQVEYVTGAAFAIRRATWERVGPFDDGFYPGYYEESDYCYRARRHGIETLYVPVARVSHLRSGTEWKEDPIRHTVNQHRSRYRFVCKHFEGDDLRAFFAAEQCALENETYFDQAFSRILAARATLRALNEIASRRAADLNDTSSEMLMRHWQVGFAALARRAFAAAETMSPSLIALRLDAVRTLIGDAREHEQAASAQLYTTLSAPVRTPSRVQDLFRRLLARLTGYEAFGLDDALALSARLYEMNVQQGARLDQLEVAANQLEVAIHQLEAEHSRRLTILEMLFAYDER